MKKEGCNPAKVDLASALLPVVMVPIEQGNRAGKVERFIGRWVLMTAFATAASAAGAAAGAAGISYFSGSETFVASQAAAMSAIGAVILGGVLSGLYLSSSTLQQFSGPVCATKELDALGSAVGVLLLSVAAGAIGHRLLGGATMSLYEVLITQAVGAGLIDSIVGPCCLRRAPRR